MRKIALCLIATMVLVVGFGSVAYAQGVSNAAFYDVVNWPTGYACQATDSGGTGAWFTYWQQGGASGGYIETDGLTNPDAHPSSFDLLKGNLAGDEGFFIHGFPYEASMNDGEYSDDAQRPGTGAGDVVVYAIAYACAAGDCSEGLPGNCYNPADFAASTDSTLHLVYGAATLTLPMNAAGTTRYAFPMVDLATRVVKHPLQWGGATGDSKVMTGKSSTYQGALNWVHLEFDETIVPPPLPSAGLPFFPTMNINADTDPLGNVRYGARVLFSTKAVGTAIPTDYALVYGDTQDFARLTQSAVSGEWGVNGSFNYVNHGIDSVLNPGLHYITQPMLGPDATHPGGIEVLVHAGSWSPAGPGSGPGPISGIPPPATVVSFDADFDPATGKVALNWRSAAEQNLDGYNVWRELKLDGRPLGSRANVGFAPAKGPSDYSLTDTPDVSSYSRLARGRPIDATYSLEEVNTDGTTNVINTTSVQLGSSTRTRSR